ncbi:acyltransferase [Oceanihabitans sediminis]|uniref:acyltransferase n=1 Tax=Oceanihabitans sediminis TaxID=1812012 RepID=UPI00299CD46C|nr:acyltransferase [Oceanihabitans sediminis]MDX1774868.1 acyltransferase [Oceanihabitans sediminis]
MRKISIIYSWFVRTITYFLPNTPFLMRFRGFLYSLMIRNCGRNFQVSSSVIINSLFHLKIGSNVYIAHNTVIIGHNIQIKDEVIIGPNCVISSGNHVFDGNSYRFRPSISNKVIIGEGSWVAGNCSITAGAILPNKSILAAGAVLNKPFNQERSIYAGVPAKLIKSIVTS